LKRAGVDLIDHGSLPPSWSGAEGLVQMDSRGHAVSCEFMNRRSSGTVVASEWFISFAGRTEMPRIGPQSHRGYFANSWTTPGPRRSAAAKFTPPAEIAPSSTIRPAEDISTDFTFDRGARMLPRSAAKIALAYQNDGKVGHDAFAVIRETIREMNKIAIGRVVLTNREHIIALEPLDKGLMGTLLRYPYEVRSEEEYFDEIQDVKVTKDMLDLARHIVNQKAGHFEPDKFEDQYETALIDLINQKRAGKPITAKERPRGENVVDLMDALRKSIGAAEPAKNSKPAKKQRKVASGQKEMLMPIAGKKPAKEAGAKKPAARPQRKSA